MIEKIKYKLKWAFNDFIGLFVEQVNFNGLRGEVRTLCFHGVCEDSDQYINGRFLHVSRFKSLLSSLSKQANFISLQDFIDGRLSSERLNILITFDDGYKNNQDLAFPFCEENNIPITIFVTTNKLGCLWMDLFDLAFANNLDLSKILSEYPKAPIQNNSLFKKWMFKQDLQIVLKVTELLYKHTYTIRESNEVFWQLLSKEDLMKLGKEELVSLANHSANHLSFVNLSQNQIERELSQCKEYLESLGSPFAQVFAYPFNHYSQELISELKRLGYSQQFLADGAGKNTKEDRLVINPFISLRNQLIAIANGKY